MSALLAILFSKGGFIVFPLVVAAAGGAASFFIPVLGKRIATIALFAAVLLFAVGAIYRSGVEAEAYRNQIAALEAEKKLAEFDRDSARSALALSESQGQAIANVAQERLENLNDLEAELAKRPDADRCRATAADLKRVFPR